MKFRQETLADRVILKPKIEKVSKGGIVLARDKRTQAINTNQGEVLLIGPQCWHHLPEKPNIKPGDTVYYAHHGALTIQPDDEEDFYVLCNDVDILVGYTGNELNREVLE